MPNVPFIIVGIKFYLKMFLWKRIYSLLIKMKERPKLIHIYCVKETSLIEFDMGLSQNVDVTSGSRTMP